MRTSELLKKAKKHLWNGRGETPYCGVGLCSAIYMARFRNTNLAHPDHKIHKVAGSVAVRIAKALGKNSFVQQWLVAKKHATLEQVHNPKLMQAYRRRWLDALIAEYESKGD